MRAVIFLFTFFLVFSFTSSAQDSTKTVKTLSIKTSIIQFLGFRFPIILEKGYKRRFSTEIGVGPTLGRKALKFSGYSDDSFTDYSRVQKRKVNLHFQAAQKFYFKADTYAGHYLKLLYRYGYFDTMIAGEDTYLQKDQFYLTYGFKHSNGPVLFEYWTGVGAEIGRERYHISGYYAYAPEGEQYSEYFVTRSWGLIPAFILGVNIGLNLK